MRDEDDAFYVAVQNPRDFRRELLGAGKDVIRLIQKNEHIKEVRAEKIKKMFEFSDALSEIGMIMNKMKKVVPATKLRKLSSKLKKEKKEEPKKKKNNQLATLQKELELIESKLDGLTQ